MPTSDGPILLYANQAQEDLKHLFSTAIAEASDSILLIIYALSDDHLIQQLKEKSDQGVYVNVICDAVASQYVEHKLGPKVHCTPRKTGGLMHDKILVIDRKKIWVGSANWTGQSLRFHGNLVVGLENQEMAAHLTNHAAKMTSSVKPLLPVPEMRYKVGIQNIELWLLPNQAAVGRIIRLIQTAQKTIRIAMFTWTRKDFAQAVVEAHRRGVQTSVILDRQSAKGAGKKIHKFLKEKGVPVRCNCGNTLLHHKFLYIDDTLVNGSANWTGAAFSKNDDCVLIIERLTEEQKKYMENLWQVILQESKQS
jgi:phosphatidylserine/phosphatidylglycerophosphate/cardiolipin synthase-like enzyme